ncbi:hypothetical protein ACSBR2_011131 [Camellia fascicularis]
MTHLAKVIPNIWKLNEVHYPLQAIQSVPFSESKVQLLEAQKAELRCLLPRSLLDHGFFSTILTTERKQ